MKEFFVFLKAHPVAWILPIVVFVALLTWVAWQIGATPDSPFVYRSG
jgi:hypothetical protein